MKVTFTYILAATLFLTINANARSAFKVPHPRNKRIVLVRPVKPHRYISKPYKIKRGYVWVEGHWQWNKKTGNYVWVKARFIKKNNRKVWINGYWKPVKGGWVYRQGKWA